MKTKSLRIGKSSLSVVLSILMIVSTVIVGGSYGTADARTVDSSSVVEVVDDAAAADNNSSDVSVDVALADDKSADVSENVTAADDNSIAVDIDADSITSQLTAAAQSDSTSTETAAVSNKKSEKVLPESSGDTTITYSELVNTPIASGTRRVLVNNKGLTDWSAGIGIYAFDDAGRATGAEWGSFPLMIKVTDLTGTDFNNLYYYDISDASTKVVLTNDIYYKNQDSANQTVDISLGSGQVRLITLTANGQINSGTDYNKRNQYSVSDYTLDSNKPLTGNVTVYAKTGTIRDKVGYNETKYGNFDKYSKLAKSVKIAYTDGTSLTTTDNDWKYNGYGNESGMRLTYADVARNKEITVTVELKDAYKSTYYVKAFCINGDSYNIIDEATAKTKNGVYTCTYTISDRETGPIEITPIYYYFENDSNDYITFSVEDFTEDVKSIWGNTIACYAYYGVGTDYSGDITLTGDRAAASSADKPALGGYPGQPMVKIDGIYYMQIPKTVNGNKIEGITLNNYIWDDIHAQKINGIASSGAQAQKDVQLKNAQTYDYDDFVALSERDTDKIVFRFKYRTYNNPHTAGDTVGNSTLGNYPGSRTDKTGYNNNLDEFVLASDGNGWEVLTDYEGYPVDLFARRFDSGARDDAGNVICETQSAVDKISTDTVYVVSNGYEPYYYGDGARYKYIGQYATKWYVYTKGSNGQYKYIGALPPSAFMTGVNADKEVPVTAGVPLSASNDTSRTRFLSYLKNENGTLKSNKISATDENNEWNEYITIYNACAGKHVVIAYESNIYSQGKQDTTANPGFRCDGRWTYSKPDEKINAKVKIQIIDSNGNIIIQEKDGTKSYFDEFTSEDSHTGYKTNANAFFTNDNYYGATEQNDVTKSNTEKFTFVANENSTGNDGKYYIFRGWYVYTGDTAYTEGTTHSNEYTEVNVGDDIFKTDGERLKDASVTLVARYEEVDPSEVLRVSHNLLSSITDDWSTPVVHNGTGETKVTVQILDASGNTAWTKTGTDVTVPADILARYKDLNGYQIKVTLTTETDKDTSVVGVYRRDYPEEVDTYAYDYYKSGVGSKEYQSTGGNIKSPDPIKAPDSTTIKTSTTDNTKTSTLVYTYDFSDLYNQESGKNTTLKTNSLDYFSDPEYNGLKIAHELYSDDADRESVYNAPDVHGGDISSLGVTVSIVDKDGNVVIVDGKPLTFTGDGTATSKSVDITSELLKNYKNAADGYQLKITLPATADAANNSKVDALYRKDTTSGNRITYVESNTDKTNTRSDWKNISGDYGENGKTYTYDISKLFGADGELNTSLIKFLSDASRYLTVEFKYYDRARVNNEAATINETETTVTRDVPIIPLRGVTDEMIPMGIQGAIFNALYDIDNSPMDYIGNIIDEYYFWTSQGDAEFGIQQLPNYREDPSGETKYEDTTTTDGKEFDYANHTDPYGRFTNETGFLKSVKASNWVTYYNGDTLLTEEEADILENYQDQVTKVVVWAYNTPKRYTVGVYALEDATAELSESVNYNGDTVYYVDADNAWDALRNQTGFYNQRLDVNDNENYDKGGVKSNDPAAYLDKYGISQAFVSDREVKSAPTANNGNLVFDGWYVLNDDNSLTKVSSEDTYGNRITTPLTLVAGYRQQKSTAVGVSVTNNGVDYYIDSNNNQKVRLNTELNVYGAKDNDPKITDVSAIYVRLDKDTVITDDVIKAVRKNLEDNSYANGTVITGTDEVTVNGKVIRYDYTVGSDVTLTNKNRIQFVLAMSVNSFNNGGNSKVLSFGAINYDGKWIYSDNTAVFDGSKVDGQTPKGNIVPSTAAIEDELTAASVDISDVVTVPEFPED